MAALEEETTQRSNAAERLFSGRTVLCDGAMGTMLYSRGVFINRCYDELNLTQPEMVRSVHTEYLQAGAEVIETNTFGANRFRLEHYGLRDRLCEINQAGVRLARECVDELREKQATDAFVAGAVGPLGVVLEPMGGTVSLPEAREAFAEQIRALVASPGVVQPPGRRTETPDGRTSTPVDLLVLETMPTLLEAEQALRAARTEAPELPVLVMVSVDEESLCRDGATPEEVAERLSELGATAVGCNCSAGPGAVLRTVERMRAVTQLPLAAMPNEGTPRSVDGRTIYMSSPEYMASYARRFLRAGASLVGGCCGTTPSHIRAMRGALRALDAQVAGTETGAGSPAAAPVESAVAPPPLAERSHLGALIAGGSFATLVEIVPPKGVDCSKEIDGAAYLHRLGVDAINVPDSPRASARMSASSLCVQIQQRVGIETVLHYTCRDRNILSIQSDLIGASSIGLRNILCLTGDPPKLGNYPDATAVFDVDAIGLVRVVEGLNRGLDIGRNPIGGSTGFTVSVAANPGVPEIDGEIRRFASKVEAGAEFCITQPVFDLRLLEQFLRRIEEFRIPVIAGIWPLTSLKNAQFMKNDLRVSMPEEILNRMAVSASPEAARAEGVRIAREMLAEVRSEVQGVQVSAPFGKYTAAAQVLDLEGE